MAILLMAMMVVAYMPAFAFAEGTATDDAVVESNDNEAEVLTAQEAAPVLRAAGDPETPGEPDPEPQPAFTDFKVALGNNDTKADLTWAVEPAPAEGAVFVVYQDEAEIARVTDATSYTAEGLAFKTTYTFRVELQVEGEVVASTDPVEYTTPPQRPWSVTKFSTLSSFNAIILNWGKVSNADSYVIYWSTSASGPYSNKIIVPSGDTLTYTFPVAVQSLEKRYYFRIFAKLNGQLSRTFASRNDEAVRPLCYSFKFKAACKLTSHGGISRSNTPFAKNQVIVADAFQRGQYRFWYNGSYYYANRVRTKAHGVARINNKLVYTDAEAESYVNRRGLTSSKNYLIWTSGYTQRLYIFSGSKGKWKVVNKGGWQVSSGKPSSPTANGMTKISRRMKSNHGIAYWNVCNVYSLHGKNKKWALGYPKSGACVRNTNDHAKWIFTHVPLNTAVIFF